MRRNKTHGWGPTTVDFVAGGTMMVLLRLGAAAGGTAFAALPDTEALLPALEAVLSGLGRQESNPLFGDEDAHGVVDRVAAARSAQVELSFQEQSLCAEAWDALRPLRWAEQQVPPAAPPPAFVCTTAARGLERRRRRRGRACWRRRRGSRRWWTTPTPSSAACSTPRTRCWCPNAETAFRPAPRPHRGPDRTRGTLHRLQWWPGAAARR